MDHQVFRHWVADDTYNRRHPRGEHQVVYVYNASGHSIEGCKDELSSKNMSIKFLPPNATQLCQSADSLGDVVDGMGKKFHLEHKQAFSKPNRTKMSRQTQQSR